MICPLAQVVDSHMRKNPLDQVDDEANLRETVDLGQISHKSIKSEGKNLL